MGKRTTIALLTAISICATIPVSQQNATRSKTRYYIELHEGQGSVAISGVFVDRNGCERTRRNIHVRSPDAWTTCTNEKGPGPVTDRAK